jgi:hypothetical protein
MVNVGDTVLLKVGVKVRVWAVVGDGEMVIV